MFSKLINTSVFFLLMICLSCSEKIDDPTPSPSLSQLIVGTWKFQSATGTATVASKKIDLVNDLELPDKNGTTQTIKKTVAWVFNENGTGTQDGDAVTYKIADKTITVTKGKKVFTLSVVINNNQLDITETETGIKPIIDDYNALLSTSNVVSSYNRTQSYKSLKDILSTNGTPSCLVKTATTIEGDYKTVYEYTYNDENKIIAYSYKNTNLNTNFVGGSNYRLEEDRSNLGSDTKPYVKVYRNNIFSANYYCDKKGRVNRIEGFDFPTDKYSSYANIQEYDSNNNNIKTNYLYYNRDTGVKDSFFFIDEYEYLNGNLVKYYPSSKNTSRYLSFEVTAWTPEPRKTKRAYLFNYGNTSSTDDQKNYPSKVSNYNSAGTKTSEYIYTYTFDSKGYLLTEKISDGSKTKSTITYEYFACK